MVTGALRYGKTVEVAGLVVAVGLCVGVGALGSVWTAESVRGWYAALAKPPITPPGWVFAPVWTTLYILMGFAAWRVWRKARFGGASAALILFCIQLALNLAWSYLFFGRHWIGLALADIATLVCAITATAVFFARIDRLAAWMLVPYLAWVTYASALNAWIWVLNRPG
jgi:tryptophan-rich sensory protein